MTEMANYVEVPITATELALVIGALLPEDLLEFQKDIQKVLQEGKDLNPILVGWKYALDYALGTAPMDPEVEALLLEQTRRTSEKQQEH